MLSFFNDCSKPTDEDIVFIGSLSIFYYMVKKVNYHFTNFLKVLLCFPHYENLCKCQPEIQCPFKVHTDLSNCRSLCVVYSGYFIEICKLINWIEFNSKLQILFCFIGLMSRGFTNDPGDWGSIPGRAIPKTQKMVLGASLLNTQDYKVRIKGKVKQSRERSSALSYTSV